MKKIGVLTFQNAYNYGAVLQAYALKTVIGESCDVINYHNEYFEQLEQSFHKEKSIKRKIIKVFYKSKLDKRVERFEKFRKNFLIKQQPLIKDNELKNLNNKYNQFITGSDQVWNLNCSGGNKAYFLNFVNDIKKKNSYAASFGSESIDIESREITKSLLKEFNNISIREKSGQKIIKDLLGKDVPVVLDPTMLLTSNEWNNISKEINFNKKYILVYTVLNGDKIVDFAKIMSKITGLEIRCITTSLKPSFGIKCIRDAGPLEWLSLMENAEMVITNSFHGLAFSLIYNKNFYIELLPPPAQTNARIKELLEDLNLSHRVIKNVENIEIKDIDYTKVNTRLNERRKESLNFLDKIIKGE